jgi:hypothetical protein
MADMGGAAEIVEVDETLQGKTESAAKNKNDGVHSSMRRPAPRSGRGGAPRAHLFWVKVRRVGKKLTMRESNEAFGILHELRTGLQLVRVVRVARHEIVERD